MYDPGPAPIAKMNSETQNITMVAATLMSWVMMNKNADEPSPPTSVKMVRTDRSDSRFEAIKESAAFEAHSSPRIMPRYGSANRNPACERSNPSRSTMNCDGEVGAKRGVGAPLDAVAMSGHVRNARCK